MPKRIAVPKNPRTERIRDNVARLLCPKQPTIEPSPDTQLRIDELSEPTPTELDCSVGGGVGLQKIADSNRRICVVCRDALRDIPRPERKALIQDRESYMLYRLPYFEQWLVVGRFEAADDQLKHTA